MNNPQSKSDHLQECADIRKRMIGGLTDDEWSEICALDYVLIWGFGDEKKNLKRYHELAAKRRNLKK